MDGNSPEKWFKSLPILTRSLLVTLFATTCLVGMGLLDPHSIILDWGLVTRKYVVPESFQCELCRYHLWRLISSGLFLGGFSFGFVMQLYLFTNFSSKLEANPRFAAVPGEYLYFLFVISFLVASFSLLLAWPRGYPLTGPSIIFAIIYYWSRCEPEAPLSIWGFQVKGYQLPFALVFISLLMGGDIWKDILGIVAGHLYHFLKDVVPIEYNVNVLKAPRIFSLAYKKITGEAAPPAAPAAPGGGMFVGGGYRLGGM